MKRFLNFATIFTLLWLSTGCERNNPEPNAKLTPQERTLVNYPWRLVDVTDANGRSIPQNQLNLETQLIYLFDIQFFENNITKALDRVSRQVINGGTWYLVEDAKVLDVEVSQFKGKFAVGELSSSKLTLKNKVPVNGVEQDANLVFQPVVQ
ncbi:hypothetical protein GCM10027275_14510 [Rhabdobacter roseus]|uniref:Lipoprotein n=1 Tax=Rhabdobacter roseus TaxID=1655419 RepID=A0A840TTP9_9BACT|nr:hypothetical protein [Rhabdobacter roseus]MBB5283370.1 hypothetical protein [Rhabdobacter roseus]